MTHDLLRNVIHDLKASVQKIVVCDLQENTFYALIYLSLDGETVAIDARPSDAIALALRSRAPIFVEDDGHRARQDGRLLVGEGRLPIGCRSGSRASIRTIWASTRCSSGRVSGRRNRHAVTLGSCRVRQLC